MPDEWDDFQLMRRMRWSWTDLTGQPGTPAYVATFCGHFVELVDQARARANRKR